jgi:hypothetical protein
MTSLENQAARLNAYRLSFAEVWRGPAALVYLQESLYERGLRKKVSSIKGRMEVEEEL